MPGRSVSFSIISLLMLLVFCLSSQLTMSQEKYVRTPADYEGPFYPVNRQQDEDNNLVQVTGQPQPAKGDILRLSGMVVNTDGRPINKATVEIWQTDPNGLYKDYRDRSAGRRDQNFQYWGTAKTNADGTFSFITLVPGKYEPRPAHIHFKVWIGNRAVLTSQMYFRNHPAGVRKGISSTTNDLQTVDLQKAPSGGFAAFIRIVL
jgi:protocatechuate 3,4-dioxygenase beta subunit